MSPEDSMPSAVLIHRQRVQDVDHVAEHTRRSVRHDYGILSVRLARLHNEILPKSTLDFSGRIL